MALFVARAHSRPCLLCVCALKGTCPCLLLWATNPEIGDLCFTASDVSLPVVEMRLHHSQPTESRFFNDLPGRLLTAPFSLCLSLSVFPGLLPFQQARGRAEEALSSHQPYSSHVPVFRHQPHHHHLGQLREGEYRAGWQEGGEGEGKQAAIAFSLVSPCFRHQQPSPAFQGLGQLAQGGAGIRFSRCL